MRKLSYLLMFFAVAFFASCEDKEKITIAENPTIPELSAPTASSLIFTKAQAAETIDFEWAASDFGFDASVTYAVQLSTDEAFSKIFALATTQTTSASVSVGDFNGTLIGAGLSTDKEATVYIRVSATVSTNYDAIISAVKSVAVSPYETLVDYPMIYVPGKYQDWSPGADIGRLYSYEFNDTYEGIIRIVETAEQNGEFKITEGPNWDVNHGGTLVESNGNYSGTLGAGDNMVVAPGTYEFTVNIAGMTIELKKTDDWGIIGYATTGDDSGWGADIDMLYDGQRKMWTFTGDLFAGSFKFRANDDWALNVGARAGEGDADGNIVLAESGNYTIRFSTEDNSYKVIKN